MMYPLVEHKKTDYEKTYIYNNVWADDGGYVGIMHRGCG